jgi:hypothetical protein
MRLFIDIETIPDQRKGALDRVQVKVPANYKKQETIDKYIEEHREETWKKTALDGTYGEICSIAWAIDDYPVDSYTRTNRFSESEALEGFFAALREYRREGEGVYQQIEWTGHNVEFDLRLLKQRAIVCQVKPPFIPADARHGQGNVFCTMREWCGWKGGISLDNLCYALGIEGKGDIDGSMVPDLWAAGEYDKIREYNVRDVEIVRDIYRRLTWS